jgi:hypothetical protein
MRTIVVFMLCAVWLSACAAPTPQVVKETVIVPKEVTRVVERVVTATPAPATPIVAAKEISFKRDILPLFTQPNKWFEDSPPCSSCHFANSDKSAHEMNLSTYEGILKGEDVVSEPPGVPIIVPGKWAESVLRERLRNNRMPPGWTFMMDESNRNGPCLQVAGDKLQMVKDADGSFKYGCDLNTVGLLGTWVDAKAPKTESFKYGPLSNLTFEKDVLPLFTKDNMWFKGSQACITCHFANSDKSAHEMDLSSYEGILKGADVLEKPPGESIIVPGKWAESVLRERLRNNRMPPGWTFMMDESNRNGPMVKHPVTGKEVPLIQILEEWVNAGAPNN